MTITQKQHLLNYLGYDTGGVDGIWGKLSQKAEQDFRAARNCPDAPCIVSSGIRCEKHNKAVGGAAGSRHLSGKAMDFRIQSRSATETLSYVQSLPGVRYAYAIDKNYVHMDVK